MKKEKRNFKLKMHYGCGADELRPIMSHVYFENGYMVATDAHILVKAAIQHFSDFDKSEVDILNGKFLHKDTFKKILSINMVNVTEDGVVDMATKDLYKFADPGKKYPNYEVVMPKNFAPVKAIGINPKIATKLFKVLDVEDIYSLELNFVSENRGIFLKGLGEHEGALECVLMPVLLNN